MVSLKINDVPVQVPRGSTILEAAKLAKAYVPTICYHPMLPVSGNCRICLVEMSKKGGKMLPACNTPVENGMEVYTDTKRTRESGMLRYRPFIGG
jgi:NADH dehydrogenase/NADH:ubiquinone oxidoreductase subunit G